MILKDYYRIINIMIGQVTSVSTFIVTIVLSYSLNVLHIYMYILFVSVCYHTLSLLHSVNSHPKLQLQLQADGDFDPLTVEPPSMLGLGDEKISQILKKADSQGTIGCTPNSVPVYPWYLLCSHP